MNADTKQEGGSHYKKVPPEFQHWNLVVVHNWNYFQAQAIKYLMRYRDKNGVQDLRKGLHFLEKMIELESPTPKEVPSKPWVDPATEPGKGYVNQD